MSCDITLHSVKSLHKQQTTYFRKPIEGALEASSGGGEDETVTEHVHEGDNVNEETRHRVLALRVHVLVGVEQ